MVTLKKRSLLTVFLMAVFTLSFLGFGVIDTSAARGPRPPIIVVSTSTPVIKVLTPNGGESYVQGESVLVRWNTNLPADQKLNLILWLGDKGIGKELGVVRAGDKQYLWKAEYVDSILSTESNPPTRFYSNGKFQMGLYCPATDSICMKNSGENYADRSDSSFTIKSGPVINSLSPSSGLVGTKVIINGSNFKIGRNNTISFVGSTNLVPGAATSSASPINGEVTIRNINSSTGNNLAFAIPSKMASTIGEDGLNYPGAAVIPGNYYVIVETSDGKSKPSYFKVTGNATGTPATSTIPNVSMISYPTLVKNVLTPPGSATSTVMYTASFNMNIANPLNTDIILGLPNSSWPAFGTTFDYVKIYKNGVVSTSSYNLVASYTYPVGGTVSTDGKTFKVLARSVSNVRVSYSFVVLGTNSSLYSLALTGLGWGTETSPRQMLPISMVTPVAYGDGKYTQTADVTTASGGLFQGLWNVLFGWFR